jgi:hypothetical protein
MSGGERGTGGGRMQVTATSGGKRGTRGGRTQAISQHCTTSHCTQNTRGMRTQVRTMSSGKRGVPGVVEHESAQQAAVVEEPAVREGESRQRTAARLNKTFEI